LLIESNGVLEVRWQQKALQPFVHEHLFRQKTIQRTWNVLDVTSGVRKEGDAIRHYIHRNPPAAILTLTIPYQQA